MDELDRQIDDTLKAKPPRGKALWKRLYARLDTIEQWLNDGGTVTALANGMDISMPAVHRALQKARKHKESVGSAVDNAPTPALVQQQPAHKPGGAKAKLEATRIARPGLAGLKREDETNLFK